MKSTPNPPRRVSLRPRTEALKLTAVALASAAMLFAQTQASITTISVPTYGQAFFDSAGNQYYMQGPVTPGSAQSQPGGGDCPVYTGGFGPGVIYEPCPDAQIVKVDPSGKVVFGTNLGGPTADSGTALAIDPSGNVFIAGSTHGQFPPTSGAAIPSSATAATFAARLSSDGSTFLYSTYLPDSLAKATAIAIDTQDNAYITGTTTSGGCTIVKLSADGSTIIYDVALGPGSNTSSPIATAPTSADTVVAIDPSGDAIVAGWTSSANFPVTSGALQSSLNGSQNLFLVKLDPSGNVLFSTYLGGSGYDVPAVLQTDSSGNIYLAGSTSSIDFPTTPGTFQPAAIVPLWNNFGPGGFVAKLNPAATQLIWSTYVMSVDGGLEVGVQQMTVVPSGEVYLGGVTGAGFPVSPSAPAVCFAGASAGFIAHLNSQGALADATYLIASETPSPFEQVNAVYGLAANSSGKVLAVWHYSGSNVASAIGFGSAGSMAAACLSPSVLNAVTMTANNGIAPGEFVTLTGFGIGPAEGISYTPGPQGQIPTETGGVQVLFGTTPAPVIYASSQQVNAIAPANASDSSVTVIYNRQQFGPIAVPVSFGSPGFLRRNPGYSTQGDANNEDGTPNSPSNPAAPGSVVSLWATGYGPTNPPCTSGELNVPEASGLAPGVSAIVSNGSTSVTYAGSSPGLPCGIVQINLRLPQQATGGSLFVQPWVQQSIGNSITSYGSQTGVMISVK